jgi:hypothetical protein
MRSILKEIEEDELPTLGQAILYIIKNRYPGLKDSTIVFDRFYHDEPDDLRADISYYMGGAYRLHKHSVCVSFYAEWIWAQRPEQSREDEGEYQVIRVDVKWSYHAKKYGAKYDWDTEERKLQSTYYIYGEVLRDFEIGPIKESKKEND